MLKQLQAERGPKIDAVAQLASQNGIFLEKSKPNFPLTDSSDEGPGYRMSPAMRTSAKVVERAQKLHEQAMEACARGRHRQARSFCSRSLAILKWALGPRHPEVARVLNTLAATYEGEGDYAEAGKLYRQAIKNLKSARGVREIRALHIQTLQSLGSMKVVQSQYRLAERYLRKALALAEKSLGRDNVEISGVLNALGVLCKYTARFDDAERFYRRALSIGKRILGANHPDVAITLNNLALLYQATGRIKAARTAYGQALLTFTKTLGPRHPNSISCRENYIQFLTERKSSPRH